MLDSLHTSSRVTWPHPGLCTSGCNPPFRTIPLEPFAAVQSPTRHTCHTQTPHGDTDVTQTHLTDVTQTDTGMQTDTDTHTSHKQHTSHKRHLTHTQTQGCTHRRHRRRHTIARRHTHTHTSHTDRRRHTQTSHTGVDTQ